MPNEEPKTGETPATPVEEKPEPVAPVVPTPPVTPPVETPISPMVERFASKLKAELGENYSDKFDKMGVEARIDAMEATLDVMNKSKTKTPLQKPAGKTPLGEPAPVDKKHETFLERQQSKGYSAKMHDAGGYGQLTEKLYGK